MKKAAFALALSMALSLSALFVPPAQAEQWSSPTQITTLKLYLHVAPSTSADGSKIAFSAWVGNDTEIFVVNSDGTELKQLTSNSRMDAYPSMSSDGGKIAFLSFRLMRFGSGEPLPIDYQLFVVNSDGTGLKQLTNGTIESGVPSISGDGSKIAFCSGALFVVNSDGTGLKQLTNGTNDLNPSISGDGGKIAFVSKVYDADPLSGGYDPNDDYELLVINSDGTARTQLTFNFTTNYFDTRPSITTDGSKIAFSDGPLFMINSDGTGLKQLTSNGTARVLFPSITSDGSKIAYSSSSYMYGDNSQTFFLISTDGTELTNLGSWSYSSVAGGPSISDDGSTIAIPFYEGIFVSLNLDMYTDLNAPVSADDYDGQWHTTDFNINITASDDLIVAKTYYKVNGGATKNVAADGMPLITTEGANNTLEYWSVDITGKNEQHKLLTGIKLDKTAPNGAITINKNDSHTFSTSVTLSLSANDVSGVAQMRFSNNGNDWTNWETYVDTKSWTLTLEEGNKTVYVQFKDNAGWVSDVHSDTIKFTSAKPEPIPTTLVVALVVSIVVVGTGLLVHFKKHKR